MRHNPHLEMMLLRIAQTWLSIAFDLAPISWFFSSSSIAGSSSQESDDAAFVSREMTLFFLHWYCSSSSRVPPEWEKVTEAEKMPRQLVR